jgi:hypothetical protein
MLRDAEDQLNLAPRTLFPPVFGSDARRTCLQHPMSFQRTCDRLPSNKMAISDLLDLLRQFLITHYSMIEAGYPLSVDPNSSNDEIYDGFTLVFSSLKTDCHNLVLDFIPEVYKNLLKGEPEASSG